MNISVLNDFSQTKWTSAVVYWWCTKLISLPQGTLHYHRHQWHHHRPPQQRPSPLSARPPQRPQASASPPPRPGRGSPTQRPPRTLSSACSSRSTRPRPARGRSTALGWWLRTCWPNFRSVSAWRPSSKSTSCFIRSRKGYLKRTSL